MVTEMAHRRAEVPPVCCRSKTNPWKQLPDPRTPASSALRNPTPEELKKSPHVADARASLTPRSMGPLISRLMRPGGYPWGQDQTPHTSREMKGSIQASSARQPNVAGKGAQPPKGGGRPVLQSLQATWTNAPITRPKQTGPTATTPHYFHLEEPRLEHLVIAADSLSSPPNLESRWHARRTIVSAIGTHAGLIERELSTRHLREQAACVFAAYEGHKQYSADSSLHHRRKCSTELSHCTFCALRAETSKTISLGSCGRSSCSTTTSRRPIIMTPAHRRATRDCAWRHPPCSKKYPWGYLSQRPFLGTVPASLRGGRPAGGARLCTRTLGPSIPTMPLVRTSTSNVCVRVVLPLRCLRSL